MASKSRTKPPSARKKQSLADHKRPSPSLRVCPFCGKRPRWVSSFEASFWIECPTEDCWVGGPHANDSAEAIRRWNRRPVEKSPAYN